MLQSRLKCYARTQRLTPHTNNNGEKKTLTVRNIKHDHMWDGWERRTEAYMTLNSANNIDTIPQYLFQNTTRVIL